MNNKNVPEKSTFGNVIYTVTATAVIALICTGYFGAISGLPVTI